MINILSLSWSVDSSLGKEDLSRLVFCIILYFLIITTIREKKQLNSIINVLLFLAGLEILYSISQFFGFDPIVKNIYSGRMRMLGTIGHHNFLSEYLMMIMPLMAGVYLTTTNKYKKVFTGLLFLLSILVAILTLTRGVLISLLVVFILMSIWFLRKNREHFRNQKRQIFLILSLSVILFLLINVFLILPSNIVSRVKIFSIAKDRLTQTLTLKSRSVQSRFIIWDSALKMIKEKPLLGWGIGTFKFHFLDYRKLIKDFPEEAENVHNEYLQVWVETGLLGLVMFILLVVFYFRECFLLLKQTKDFQGSMQIAAFMFSITGVLIDSLINFPLRITPNAITFWYILGVTIASYSVYNNRVS